MAERRAMQEKDKLELTFRKWAASYCPEAWFMNPSSGTQVATLLFGGAQNVKSKEYSPTKKEFKLTRDEYEELLAARDGSVPTESEYGFVIKRGTL